MEDETLSASVAEDGAPGATDEAASAAIEADGAPATPPEGFIEQDRYENLRREFNQRNALIDRARQGDAAALQELTGYTFAEDEQDPDLGDTEEPDPLAALTKQQEALAAWAAQKEAQETDQRFNTDLDSLLGEKKLTVSQFEREGIRKEIASRSNDFDALKSVVDEIAAAKQAERDNWLQSLTPQERAKVLKAYQASKTSTYVSPGGTGATETPFRDDMSVRELTKAAEEQFRLARDQ